MGSNNDDESRDKGLLSHLHGIGAGHYPPPGLHPYYPPPAPGYGYPHQGYPSSEYPHYPTIPHGGYPYPPSGYPPSTGGYPPAAYPPVAYPGPSALLHPGVRPDMGTMVAGGLTAAAAMYGAHHIAHGGHHVMHGHGGFYGDGDGHGHGKLKHGKFGRHGMYGRWK